VAKPTGFLEYTRVDPGKRPVAERVKHYREFEALLELEELHRQAARCMDCGVPTCHMYGCPVENLIPDFNDMVYRGQWRYALDLLHKTNNFPEFTGRVCPAPCEPACTLSINQPAVTIKQIELQIIEKGWQEGWVTPVRAPIKTGKKIAVVGSGPAGLAAAQQLARRGHTAVLFEKDDRIGGLLRYGIPDFKMEKSLLDRRIEQLVSEGVIFEPNVTAGLDLLPPRIERQFDAVIMTAGAGTPRDLDLSGRDLHGVHFAMEFLSQNNRRVADDSIPADQVISAQGKDVVVIGGGDTGSDCIGTSIRQGARSVTQLELLPEPPPQRALFNPWPEWPQIMRTSSSQEEGCQRMWSVNTREFVGADGAVQQLRCVTLNWFTGEDGRAGFEENSGSEFTLDAQLVLLAMGFVHVEHGALVREFGLALDPRGNIIVDQNYMTSKPGVFAAGDSMLGASLVVRAIHHGRQAAAAVDRYVMGI
jgi:glutamate synthase (NADPH/NADH) small chain